MRCSAECRAAITFKAALGFSSRRTTDLALTSAEELFPEEQMVFSPCHIRRESLSWKCDSFSSLLNSLSLSGSYCMSESINTMPCTHSCFPTTDQRCMLQYMVNRNHDWSVHPRFSDWKKIGSIRMFVVISAELIVEFGRAKLVSSLWWNVDRIMTMMKIPGAERWAADNGRCSNARATRQNGDILGSHHFL